MTLRRVFRRAYRALSDRHNFFKIVAITINEHLYSENKRLCVRPNTRAQHLFSARFDVFGVDNKQGTDDFLLFVLVDDIFHLPIH